MSERSPLKFNYMFVLAYVENCEPLRRSLPAWKNMSGEAVQNFNVVPFDRSCLVFWQRNVLGHWRVPAFGSGFPSLKHDSSYRWMTTI